MTLGRCPLNIFCSRRTSHRVCQPPKRETLNRRPFDNPVLDVGVMATNDETAKSIMGRIKTIVGGKVNHYDIQGDAFESNKFTKGDTFD